MMDTRHCGVTASHSPHIFEDHSGLMQRANFSCPGTMPDTGWIPRVLTRNAVNEMFAVSGRTEALTACPARTHAVLGVEVPTPIRCGLTAGHDGWHRFLIEWGPDAAAAFDVEDEPRCPHGETGPHELWLDHKYWDNGHGQAEHAPYCKCVPRMCPGPDASPVTQEDQP